MNESGRYALEQRIEEYNRNHGLGAELSIDGDSILTRVGNDGVHIVRTSASLGLLVHEELVRRHLHTPVIANPAMHYWLFIVSSDIPLAEQGRIRHELWEEKDAPLTLGAPGNLLVYPKPGDTTRAWIELPPGKDRLPMSLVLDIANELRHAPASR